MESFRAFYQVYGAEMWLGLAIALAVAFLWLLVAQIRSLRAARRYQALTQGLDGVNLEQALHGQIGRLDQLVADLQALTQQHAQLRDELTAQVRRLDEQEQQASQHLSQRLDRTLHRVGVVRFNPFPDTGGDQSFAVALLDGHDNGVVFNGLHSRAGCRVYAKPVVSGASTYNLSQEEQEAIAQSKT